jgi:subtilisin family serine protease
MKKLRICSAAVALTLAFAVVAAPIVSEGKNPVSPVALSQTKEAVDISATESSIANTQNVTAANEKAVTVTADNVSQYTDETDSFYEPKSTSVTELGDGSAYINDAITLFFKDGTDGAEVDKVVDSVNGEIVGNVQWMNEYEVKIAKSDFDGIQKTCDELMKDDNVDFASCSIATKSQSAYVPNDPWGDLTDWNDDANSGTTQYNNWWIKAANIDKAWDYSSYFSKINVGVVDCGFDIEHPELKGRITFPNKFFSEHNVASTHGTHVAGIIGAAQDNNLGLSGIVRDCNMICVDWEADADDNQNWNSDARILSGFVNVVRAGAKVVNFSLGSSYEIDNGTTDRFQFVKDAEGKFVSYYVAKMLQRGYDFVCCQSAGNGTTLKDKSFYAVDASNNGNFCTITKDNAVKFVKGVTPQDIMDRIIIVSAATWLGNDKYEQASYSNGGKQVSICAPGTYVYSTYYSKDNTEYHYAFMSGTSMAAPVVTGIASLVWSINQNFTGAQIKHFVCDNTSYIVPDSSDSRHLPTGSIPMVNALLAVQAAIKASENDGTVSGKISWARVTANDKIPFTVYNNETGEAYKAFADKSGIFSVKLPEGKYTLRVNGVSQSYDEQFDIVKGKNTELDEMAIGEFNVDYGSFVGKAMDSMQNFLSSIQVY